MNSEAGARVMPMPAAAEEKKRPGRKPAESREKGGSRVLFCLGDGGTAEGDRWWFSRRSAPARAKR